MSARSVLFLTFTCIFAGCAGSSPETNQREDFGPLLRIDGNPPHQLDGIWKSRGYGWVFDIRGSNVTQYQVAGTDCFPTPDGVGALSDMLSLEYAYYRAGADPESAILQLLPDDTEVWVDRIAELPKACGHDEAASYGEMLEYFSSMMSENYAFFDQRDIEWNARVTVARNRVSGVENDTEYFQLLADMIDGFSDSHTKLLAEIDGEVLRQQDGLGTTLSRVRANDEETQWLIGLFSGLQQNVLDPGSKHAARDRILWGTIDGRIGYIQILVMGGFSGLPLSDPGFREAEFVIFDELMDEALAAMQDSEFVIVDLTNNRGGYDAISRRLVSRFAEDRVVAYQTKVPGSGVPARPRIVEPAESQRFIGPVLLLTSDVTVSGGEIATLGMTALPNVTHMGGTTRGSFSTVLAKPLPNGWVAELSNEVFSSADGVVFEETGITPEFEFEMFPANDSVGGYFEALDFAIARMREEIGNEQVSDR